MKENDLADIPDYIHALPFIAKNLNCHEIHIALKPALRILQEGIHPSPWLAFLLSNTWAENLSDNTVKWGTRKRPLILLLLL